MPRYVLGKYIFGNFGLTTTKTDTNRLATMNVGTNAAATAAKEDGPLGYSKQVSRASACPSTTALIGALMQTSRRISSDLCVHSPILIWRRVRTEEPPSLAPLLAAVMVWNSILKLQTLERVKLDKECLKQRHTRAKQENFAHRYGECGREVERQTDVRRGTVRAYY